VNALLSASAEYVDRPAVIFPGDIVWSIHGSSCHADIVCDYRSRTGVEIPLDSDLYTCGFLSSTGRFLSMTEAYALARRAGQVKRPSGIGRLQSENFMATAA